MKIQKVWRVPVLGDLSQTTVFVLGDDSLEQCFSMGSEKSVQKSIPWWSGEVSFLVTFITLNQNPAG